MSNPAQIDILLRIFPIFLGVCCSFHGEFIAVPRDQTVREGDTAVFLCTLHINGSINSASGFWEDGLSTVLTESSEISSESSEISSVTSINKTTGTITSSLQLFKVQREMDDYYRCSILIHFAEMKMKIISSGFWKLNVLYFLRDGDLHCSEPRSLTLNEGEKIRCRMRRNSLQPYNSS